MGKHSFESVKQEAKKYNTRNEFTIKNGGAYKFALKNGWLDQICGHMINGRIGLGQIHTFESCKKDAKKYKYRSEFESNHKGSYLAALKNRWLDQICVHMEKKKKHTFESLKQEAKKYKTRNEFQTKNRSAYTTAHLNGFLDQICGHMIPSHIIRRNARLYWTLDMCKKEAKKYQTKSEFKTKNGSAYFTANKNGWLDQICSHMINGRIGVGKIHTLASLEKESKKYKTRNEFKTKKYGAYQAAQKNGWLDQLCDHMVCTINLREKKLQNKIYKNLKKQYKNLDIRMEVKIPKRDNLPGRIDFIIKNPESGKFIGLELKHSESQWSTNACKIQLSKYNRAFRERKGFKGVFLISDNGSIGKSIDIIPKLIQKIL